MAWKHPTLEKSHYQSKYQIRFCYIGIDRAQGLTKNMELAHRKRVCCGSVIEFNTSSSCVKYKPVVCSGEASGHTTQARFVDDYIQLKTTDSIESS